ncbi:radical SAM protein [Thermosphaera chiliense]|uniref:Radical SAM protein n=1 Tax=Thermosphaera chiliense TaxID=3402707 RepID=A0A7M1US32_9CREN|nr:radical SAM protein [Thermosphaera aggregans]QOR94856.1 radical SAM protein [Thermosphaera aggregans]
MGLEWFISIIHARPDAILVWDDQEVRERLSWYYSVMRDLKPAKFLIAKRIPVDENPYNDELSIDDLWRIHDKASVEFKRILQEVRSGGVGLEDLVKPSFSLLDVKVALAYRLYSPCRLCERKCSALRAQGKPGVCFVDRECIVHTYFHHMGEEAPLVPSGTIFYGGCNFKCAFCQNYDISQVSPRSGERVTPERLARIQDSLRKRGARNINHVGGEPTPHLPFILESLKHLETNTPQLWNSNMYMSLESMKLLADVIDIWLPDFKYGSNECAWRLSRVRNYWEVVTRNHKLAYENGDMIIRHLVLPNHVECCTRKVLEWIAGNTPRVLVNIMEQYRPEHLVSKYPEKYPDISRRPSRDEMKRAYEIADNLGIVYKPVS